MDKKSQLQGLLEASDTIRDSLQSLKQNLMNKNIPELSATEYLLEAIQNRQTLRDMAETLEKNRKMLQYNKQKYKRSRTFLQGLEYYKATIKEKINDYEINVEDPNDYIEDKIEEIDWETGYEESELKIKDELQKIRGKTDDLKQANLKKKELEKKFNQKKKLFKDAIPNQVRRLNEQLLETCQVFGIGNEETLEDISSAKLAKIWDNLKPQQKHCSIALKYNKEEYQSIVITLKPCNLIPQKLYKGQYFKDQPLSLTNLFRQKQMTLEISYLAPIYKNLVIGIDRNCGYSNYEVFNRLINNEEVNTVFLQPNGQKQRNINTKYVKVDWVENMMVSGFAEDALMTIRHKMIVLSVVESLIQSLDQKHEKVVNGLKISTKSTIKINFEEYLKYMKIPEHLTKSINYYKLGKISGNSSPEKLAKLYRSLETLLTKLHLGELLIPNLNQYYKISIECNKNNKNLKIDIIIIIPYQYPRKASTIKILSFKLNNMMGGDPAKPQLANLKEIKDYDSDVSCDNGYEDKAKYLEEQYKRQAKMEISELTRQLEADNHKKQSIGIIFMVYWQLIKLLSLVAKMDIF